MLVNRRFGRRPDSTRKARFNGLSNYQAGKFQNLISTPALAEGESMAKLFLEFFSKYPNTVPEYPIPFVLTDLKKLNPEEEVLIWFGHSSYFIQTKGQKFLIDPVFSGHASPFKGSVKAFPGSNHYQVEDMPEIDILLISHDHWDHLDYHTVKGLKEKTAQVICGLGVGQHFEYWGWDKNKLIEKNWYESVDVAAGFKCTLTPARHFSGRTLSRNISLWTSFVLQTPDRNLFLGGDSGYGPHFKTIGSRFGPFDLAILECGQYDVKWPYIHSLPEEIINEVRDLKAKHFLPVHHSKFKLAQHPWQEPLEHITALAAAEGLAISTPKIGEKVNLKQLDRPWEKWWENIFDYQTNQAG